MKNLSKLFKICDNIVRKSYSNLFLILVFYFIFFLFLIKAEKI
ncbi:unnamed protein product [Brugia timori]|uniref:Uncharacterized protein n=1 Tax=Brugia timori TaxID=42155 RepID=A0A0R3RBU9_9BILA|nr:unnamed protein product [Brugia timori]